MDPGPLVGVDFTCAPSTRKPVTVAHGRFDGEVLVLDALDTLTTLDAFREGLAASRRWVAAFDFPFGLPRAFVDANRLGATAAEVIAAVHERAPTRMAWRAFIDGWGNARPAGSRLLHRRTDAASAVSSTSPLQSRYVPVAFMYYEGFARLIRSGAHLPALHEGDRTRIALEGYPRRAAHALIGNRSYKNSESPDRGEARKDIVRRLAQGHAAIGFAVQVGRRDRAALIDDGSGDRLDALLCLVQAAFAARLANFGLPADVDPVEGWIVGV